MTRILAALAATAFVVAPASARQGSRYEAGFERDVNRYRWAGGIDLASRAGAWDLRLADRFRSDAFLLFDDRLSFRDENGLEASAERVLSPAASIRLSGRSDWFSLSRVLSQTAFAGIELRPGAGLRVEPMIGIATDRRPGAVTAEGVVPLRSDAGPAVGVRAGLPRTDVEGYRVRADGSAFWHRIAPRRAGGARFAAAAERTFETTRLRADVQAATIRRDAYQAASFLNRDPGTRSSESVESTRSDTARVGLSLRAPLAEGLLVDAAVNLGANNRMVRTHRAPAGALFFDSDFRRRSADLALDVTVRRGAASGRISTEAGAETERRSLANEADLPTSQASLKRDLLRQADYDRAFVTVRAEARLPIARKVALAADASANGIRHDTPVVNLDDRDEVFYSGRLGVAVRADETLELDVQAFGTWYHTVYLKAARSAENNVQRSVRLRPAVRWRPDAASRIELASEVRATYTVDDFVLPGRRPTDQSARELRYDLSVERDLAAGLRIVAEGRASDLRLGRFLTDTFAEIPFDTLRTTGGWIRLQAGGRTTAEVGLRVFVRSDFDRSATVRYGRVDAEGRPVVDGSGRPVLTSITRAGRERITQIGPTCALLVPIQGGASLRFEGWLVIQRVSHALYGDLPDQSSDAIRLAARRGVRTRIPNLSVSMAWDF